MIRLGQAYLNALVTLCFSLFFFYFLRKMHLFGNSLIVCNFFFCNQRISLYRFFVTVAYFSQESSPIRTGFNPSISQSISSVDDTRTESALSFLEHSIIRQLV